MTTTTATAATSIPSSSTLKFLPADVEDIPKLIDVLYAAFDMEFVLPDTPKGREWWHNMMHNDFKDSETQPMVYIKVVDTATGQIVAFASWLWGDTIKTRKERYPPFVDDMNVSAVEAFFGGMDANRQRIMGEKPHYGMWASCSYDKRLLANNCCFFEIVLGILANDPSYQRRGIGSALVKWGCDQADQSGLPVYVDASPEGLSLYQKFGFAPNDSAPSLGVPMVRSPALTR